ncbi:MAG: molybdenum cofactor biosynthesis protein MoaE [Alphaproteobacteria bacterium]
MNNIKTIVSKNSLDVAEAIDYVSSPSHGAIDTFIGTVRNNHQGKEVTGITYDAHKILAEKAFQEICVEAQGFWPETQYYVAHYQGELEVGGMSIIIAVGSPHRAESFDACRYVIEEIKKRSPIWKKEHYIDEKSDWLPGHSLIAEAEASQSCCGHCGGEASGS